MQSQLELRDRHIHELKRMYKEAREAEARNAEVIQQLRVELARRDGCVQSASASQHNSGMMKHNVGMTNGDLQQTNDRIAHLQSQLRYVHQCCFLK